jgi:hypothetical protein
MRRNNDLNREKKVKINYCGGKIFLSSVINLCKMRSPWLQPPSSKEACGDEVGWFTESMLLLA